VAEPGTVRAVGDPATVRADAAVTATFDAVAVTPAVTQKGHEAQTLQMMGELRAKMVGLTPEQFADRWDAAITTRVKQRKKRGPSTTPEKNPCRAYVFRAFDKAQREGRLECKEKLSVVKGVIREHTKRDRRQVDRWFEQWKLEQEHGHN
jgi:hypothetical protein